MAPFLGEICSFLGGVLLAAHGIQDEDLSEVRRIFVAYIWGSEGCRSTLSLVVVSVRICSMELPLRQWTFWLRRHHMSSSHGALHIKIYQVWRDMIGGVFTFLLFGFHPCQSTMGIGIISSSAVWLECVRSGLKSKTKDSKAGSPAVLKKRLSDWESQPASQTRCCNGLSTPQDPNVNLLKCGSVLQVSLWYAYQLGFRRHHDWK